MKKLSAAHIEQLYAFTRAHFVDYYDVQTELVDHLANGIEAQWAANPDLDFEQALDIEFKKFGVMGFAEIVQETQNHYTQKFNKLQQQGFLKFMQIKVVLLLNIILSGFAFIFIHWLDYILLLMLVPIVLLFTFLGFLYNQNKIFQHKKLVRQQEKLACLQVLLTHRVSAFSWLHSLLFGIIGAYNFFSGLWVTQLGWIVSIQLFFWLYYRHYYWYKIANKHTLELSSLLNLKKV